MNFFNIQRAFKNKKERGYDKVYFAIDLHDVIIKGTYTRYNENRYIYPDCVKFFQWAKTRPDVVLILWSSSHRDSLDEVLHWLKVHGIEFHYINENPLEPSGKLCDFSDKFYFSVLLDDKASFNGETDWILVCRAIEIETGDKIIDWNQANKKRLELSIESSKNELDKLAVF